MNRSIVLLLALAAASCSESHVVTPTTPTSTLPPVAYFGPDAFIKGYVSDSAGRHLTGAEVRVLDGPLAGLSTIVDASGEFSLTGTFDDSTRFRASKDGYLPATGTMNPPCERCNPHRWVVLYLDVPTPPVNVAGNYTVTFIADPACEAALPKEFRTHSFAASLTPIPQPQRPDTQFSLTPLGPSFEEFQLAWAAVAGNYVSIVFSDPGVIEEVAPHAYLSFYGGAAATVESSQVPTIAASFDGEIDYCVVAPDKEYSSANCGPGTQTKKCVSKAHQVILTRR